ncbi:hypothetical protein TNCV_1955141 [Trichonephila clavipes]|nr:hypothetical protein TNCV_1955141 [Trichonephila clavipes]
MSWQEESFLRKLRHPPEEPPSYGHFKIIKTEAGHPATRNSVWLWSEHDGMLWFRCTDIICVVRNNDRRTNNIDDFNGGSVTYHRGLWKPSAYAHELVAGMSQVQVVPLKTRRVEEADVRRSCMSSRWCGIYERGCQLRCRPRHLTEVQI